MTDKELIKKLAKNPKIKKAMEGILAPLEQEGDSVTISAGKKAESAEWEFDKLRDGGVVDY